MAIQQKDECPPIIPPTLVSLTPELLRRLDEYVEKHYPLRGRSVVVRRALKEFFDRQEQEES